jgi:hypothetical protein
LAETAPKDRIPEELGVLHPSRNREFGLVKSQLRTPLLIFAAIIGSISPDLAAARETANRSKAAQAYLNLLENFSG